MSADGVLRLPDGRALAYEECGDAEGFPVFLFHGFPGSRLEARAVAGAAAEAGVRLIGVDGPGVGGSDEQPGRIIIDWPRDAAALADFLAIERFAVAGFSGGAPYALACALALPQRVAACAVISGPAALDRPGATAGMAPGPRLLFGGGRQVPAVMSTLLRGMGRTARRDPARLVARLASGLPPADRRVLGEPAIAVSYAAALQEAFRSGVRGVVFEGRLLTGAWGVAVERSPSPSASGTAPTTATPPSRWRAARRMSSRAPGSRSSRGAGTSSSSSGLPRSWASCGASPPAEAKLAFRPTTSAARLMSTAVGRQAELETIARLLAGSSPTIVLLEGEAGIGKTTVWQAAVEEARQRGAHVLACAPAEAEVRLSHAGLADLLGAAFGEVAALLPEPQARALAVAMRIEDPGKGPPDETAVARGTLGALVALAAAHGSLVVAVDDLQWLDPLSAAALAFAARRLAGEGSVSLLLTRRAAPDEAPVRLFDRIPTEVVRLGPLSIGALHRVLRLGLGAPLSRPRLLEVYEASGGNPLHALELAQALDPARRDAPRSVTRLLGARVAALPDETRSALLLVAAAFDRSLDRLTAPGAPGSPFGPC